MVSPRHDDRTLSARPQHVIDAVERVRRRCDASDELIGRSDKLIDQSAHRVEQSIARLALSEY